MTYGDFAMTRRQLSLLLGAVLLPITAIAHPNHDATFGFTSGIAHPLTGIDHILAMVAVGLWAAQLGGRMLWAVPASFVALLVGGAMLGHFGMTLPYVEGGIAVSVVVLGGMIAMAMRLPAIACAALVGAFAIFHGYAHGAEAPDQGALVTYIAGFAISTALLHTIGIGISLWAARRLPPQALRISGAAIALSGGMLMGFAGL
jgi:urease accessory protein